MEQIQKNYKKAYQKASLVFFILVGIEFVLSVWILFSLYKNFNSISLGLFLLIDLMLVILLRAIRSIIFSRVAYNVIRTPYEDGDILGAYECSIAILDIRALYSESFVLLNHMTILCVMGRYEELEQFYEMRKERLRKRVNTSMMERELLILTSKSSQEQVLYEQLYKSFMHNMKRLSKRNHMMSVQKLQFKIEYALRHQHYEEALTLTEYYTAQTKSEIMKQAAYKSLCLWYLNRKEEAQISIDFVLNSSEEYEIVREIKALKEGTAIAPSISSAFLQEVYMDTEKWKKKRKRIKRIYIGIFALLYILIFIFLMSLSYHPYKNMTQAVSEVSDRVGEESYLQFDFDNIHVAVVKTRGKEKDNNNDDIVDTAESLANSVPFYYVNMVSERDGKIATLSLRGGAYTFNDPSVRCFPIKKSKDAVYVVFAGDYKSIKYDGESITNIKSTQMKETWKKDGVYTLNAFVIHDLNFDEGKLIVRR